MVGGLDGESILKEMTPAGSSPRPPSGSRGTSSDTRSPSRQWRPEVLGAPHLHHAEGRGRTVSILGGGAEKAWQFGGQPSVSAFGEARAYFRLAWLSRKCVLQAVMAGMVFLLLDGWNDERTDHFREDAGSYLPLMMQADGARLFNSNGSIASFDLRRCLEIRTKMHAETMWLNLGRELEMK